MAKKNTIFIAIMPILFFAAIITVLYAVFLTSFSNYGRIEESLSFEYSPNIIPTTEEISDFCLMYPEISFSLPSFFEFH